MADHPLLALLRPQIGMLVEKVSDLGLDCLGEQRTGSVAQDFGELIVEESRLNQLDNVILGHGISLLRWRSGGVKHPHDMPPSQFPPSPTFGHSSLPFGARQSSPPRSPHRRLLADADRARRHSQSPGIGHCRVRDAASSALENRRPCRRDHEPHSPAFAAACPEADLIRGLPGALLPLGP